jgi:phosphonate transport system substrate-binding protein
MPQLAQTLATIKFATFLSPVLYKTYEYIASYVGKQTGYSTALSDGQSLEDLVTEQRTVDVSFLCGLLYVHMKNWSDCPLELLAAPVLQGSRYRHRPIYYSDVIVRSDSSYASFDDLRGCTWAYNERASHSGYNLVYYSLLECGKSPAYFGETIATGSHLQSLQAVLEGRAHAAALDSHLLDVLLREKPELAAKIRRIAMLGPSTIPPIVVDRRLDANIKRQMQAVLLSMHKDTDAASELRKGRIERFVPVCDEDYDDIRAMLARVQAIEIPLMNS